jgi:hypothetical protein
MKERKECSLCKKMRVLNQFYEGYNKCKQCVLVKDDRFVKGKYIGLTIDNIKNVDRNYYDWCLKNIDNFPNS